MQTGVPSPTPVQQAPCSPITRRTGRCPNRLQAKSDELRPQEPHPLHQSVSPADVPHDEQDGCIYTYTVTNVKEMVMIIATILQAISAGTVARPSITLLNLSSDITITSMKIFSVRQ